MELLNNQTIRYFGRANMEIMGVQIIPLKSTKFKELISTFEQNNFTEFKSKYLTRMKDLPRTTITFKRNKISFQAKACPEKLVT